jgi:hypothetical protein
MLEKYYIHILHLQYFSTLQYQLSESSRQRRVPGSRVGRIMSFGSLAAGLGVGALAEVTRRGLGIGGGDKQGECNTPDRRVMSSILNAQHP